VKALPPSPIKGESVASFLDVLHSDNPILPSDPYAPLVSDFILDSLF
jgi:hypothetical protein